MSVENKLQLYPNATPNGIPIPMDVLLGFGLIRQSIGVAATNNIAIPAVTELLVIYGDASIGCYLQLGGNVTVPALGAFVVNLHWIPPGSVKVIDPDGAAILGVITNSGAGTIHIECVAKWQDTRKSAQYTRT